MIGVDTLEYEISSSNQKSVDVDCSRNILTKVNSHYWISTLRYVCGAFGKLDFSG